MIPDEELPVIAKFKVRRRAYIGPDGTAVCNLPDFASDQNLVVSMYRGMALARAFDLKAVSLQRTGRLGTYATSLGQEAVAVGNHYSAHGQTCLSGLCLLASASKICAMTSALATWITPGIGDFAVLVINDPAPGFEQPSDDFLIIS
jgi:hypothetical protein